MRDGRVLATVEVADSRRARARGLLGRDSFEGALLLRPARSVHTIGMRFPIDVAFCDGDLRVLRVVTLPRHRVTRPVPRARVAIETEAGVMAGWGLRAGDVLDVRASRPSGGSPARGRQADARTAADEGDEGRPGNADERRPAS